MNLNITKKLIANHLVEGCLEPGREIGLRMDQALIHDATGQMALLQFEAMGQSRIKMARAVIYADHNTIQVGPENMDDHLFLSTAGRKFGFHYSRPGNGICHQLHLERFSVPGQTLLGADSHTTTGGGAGMLAIGAGGLDVAAALAGRPFFMVMPEVVKFELVGALQPWVSAKDIALEMLRLLGVSGGRGKVLEFTGPGVETLNVPQRATIANMSIETGAFTAVFPSDQMTRRFLAAQGREPEWSPLSADSGADYDEVHVIDLSGLEPLIAKPHSPDNVVPVREMAGTAVDQVGIGSCTNSSLEDLCKVGAVLYGRTVAPDVSLIVTPGSRQALKGIYAYGALGSMIDAGARILENVCGFCNGLDQAPRAGGLSLRTSNRNFPGRSGTADAGICLASPETAAATAITGKITDPRTLGDAPEIVLPEKFPIDDRMILPPAAVDADIEIHRGPNISKLPRFETLPDTLEGIVLLKRDDNVTTDDILPGGANILKLRSNVPAISKFIFSRIDPTFSERAQAAGTGFIVGGLNYGQGSSREHAALAPRYLGVRAVIARSFARIHKSNLINFGILPLEFVDPADHGRIQAGDRLRMTGLIPSDGNGRTINVENLTSGISISTRIDVSDRLHEMLLAGGLLNQVRGEVG